MPTDQEWDAGRRRRDRSSGGAAASPTDGPTDAIDQPPFGTNPDQQTGSHPMQNKKTVRKSAFELMKEAAQRYSRVIDVPTDDGGPSRVEARNRTIGAWRVARERTIGLPNYVEVPPTEAVRAAGVSVARIINLPEGDFAADGFATGFIIAPGLLLTNQHVFQNAAQAQGTGAQFLYEKSDDDRPRNGVIFRLEPDTFFVSDRTLDFAVVAVAEQSIAGARPLTEFAPIIRRHDAIPIRTGDTISIIQHPDGGYKKYAFTENLVVDLFDEGFVHYTTDTLPGSSGAPAFDENWRLCALHHCGVPRMVGEDVMLKGGGVWEEGMDDNLIDWVANEGIVLSKIFAKLNEKAQTASEQHRPYYELLRNVGQIGDPVAGEPETIGPEEELGPNGIGDGGSSKEAGRYDSYRSGSAPMTIRVSLSNSNHNSIVITNNFHGVPAAGAAPQADRPPVLAPERRIRFDPSPNYANRRGYDRDFLGVRINIPDVSSDRRSEMVRRSGEIVVLRYHHFSIAMNARRRLAMWTAANVDYNGNVRDDRDRDAFGDDYWIEDTRIDSDLQLKDAEFYAPATKVDRGHLVRRQDNAWGRSPTEIEYGNSDTFHWTNCTPQHESFNRSLSGGMWGAFEEHLVRQIAGFRKRISIFAGPILADDDPSEDFGDGEVQYPVRFWKIIAGVEDGVLQAFAFIFDQSRVIERFGLERFDPGRFGRSQVSVDYISQETGVLFPQNLLDADAFAGTSPDDFPEVTPATIRRRQGEKPAQNSGESMFDQKL